MIFAPDNTVTAVRAGSKALFADETALTASMNMIPTHQRQADAAALRMVRTDMPTARGAGAFRFDIFSNDFGVTNFTARMAV